MRRVECKFGALAPERRVRLEAADAATLLRWGERILTARTLEEVFED